MYRVDEQNRVRVLAIGVKERNRLENEAGYVLYIESVEQDYFVVSFSAVKNQGPIARRTVTPPRRPGCRAGLDQITAGLRGIVRDRGLDGGEIILLQSAAVAIDYSVARDVCLCPSDLRLGRVLVRTIAAFVVAAFMLSFTRAPSPRRAEPNWVKVSDRAHWAPRDSCGELAYRGRMWLIGGWFQSFEDPPRDVWASVDGIQWTRQTARTAFQHTDLPTTLVFQDKMWIMGGWHGGRLKHASASNEVWCSTDGIDWQQVTPAAGWTPRLGAAGVVFQGKMWLLGGGQKYYFGDDHDLRNDVWYSADGATWTQATARAPWAARAYHAALVFNDRIWVFGGGNYLPNYAAQNDVWSSPDGVHWTQVAEHAPWPPRIWFSAEVYRNRIWVLGGWSNLPSKNWNDVWYTDDGNAWTQLQTKTVWSPRHEHSAFVFQDKLWVAGGNASPLVNDVWQLEIANQ